MEFENKKEKNIGISLLKKALCVFLTVLMLMGSFGGATGVFAVEATEYFDGQEIVSVSFEHEKDYVFIENTGGWKSERQVYDEDNGWHNVPYYHYFTPSPEYGDRIILTMGDESTVVYTYEYREEYGNTNFFNEYGDELDYWLYDDQSTNPWTVGGEYNYYTLEVEGGATCDIHVTIIENPVESMEFTPAHPEIYTYIEESRGNWTTRDIYDENDDYIGEENFYRYDTPSIYQGDIITINMTDGSSVDYVYISEYDDEGNWRDGFYNGDERLDYDYNNDQYTNPWVIDGEYNYIWLHIEKYGYDCYVPVTIIENPIESIEFTPANEDLYTYYENVDGSIHLRDIYDENGDCIGQEEFFLYNTYGAQEGDIITVNMKDGSSVEYVYENGCVEGDYWDYSFYNSDGEHLGYGFTTYQYNNPWVIDGEHNFVEIYISDYDYRINYPVTVNENPVESIEFTPVNPDYYTYIENANGNTDTRSLYDENGEYIGEEEFFLYNTYGAQVGDIITVNMKDGSSVDYVNCYNEDDDEWGFYNSDGERLDYGYNSDQYSNPWKIGGEHNYVIISAFGYEYKQPITIEANPVESFTFIPVNPEKYVFKENANGWWEKRKYYDEENDEWVYEDYFRYGEYGYQYGDKLILNMKDGTSVTYTYDYEEEWESGFFNEDGEYLNAGYTSDQRSNPWKIGGEHNYVILSTYGYTVNYPVTIVANPVEAISYTPADPNRFVIIENTKGEIEFDSENDDEFFCYNTPGFDDGDILTVTMTDGNDVVYTYRYDEDGDVSGFYSEDGDFISWQDVRYDSRQWDVHWTLGGENYIYYEYSGKTCTYPVTIISNPVESIEFTSVEDFVLTENRDGYWDEYEIWNEEEDDVDLIEYFRYYLPSFRDGDKITVHMTDGTSVDYVCENYYDDDEGGYLWKFLNEDGERLDFDYGSYQDENPWVIDGEYNYFYIKYQGRTCDVPVTILANPVESISFTPVNPDKFTLTEGIDGEYDYREIYDENNQYIGTEKFFVFEWDFEAGDVITLHMIGGTSAEYVYDDWDWGFYNEDGEELEYNYNTDQYEHPWTADGEYNYIYINCEGKTCEIPVTILPNPVESISFEPVKEYTLIEGVSDGYYETDEASGEKWYYYDMPGFNEGDRLTVNYTDGTTSVFTYGYDDYEDENGFFNEDGEEINVGMGSHQHENHWSAGGKHNYFNVIYASKESRIAVSVKENPVTDIKFTPAGDYVFTEGISDGYYEYDWDDDEEYRYYFFSTPRFRTGDKITVTRANGKTTDYFYNTEDNGYSSDMFTDAEGNGIVAERYTDQYNNHWAEDGDYNYFCVEYSGIVKKVPVTVKSAEVESISFNGAEDFVLTEGISGGYLTWEEDEPEDKWYRYYTPAFRLGDEIIVNFADGTSDVFTYEGEDERYDEDVFVNENGERLSVETENNQSADNRWLPDGDNFFTVFAAGTETEVRVTVKPNPVEEITFTPANPEDYILTEELSNGNYNTLYGEDEEEERYYYYSAPDFREGDKITVVMNGEAVDYFYDVREMGFTSGDGWINVWPYSYQEENHWKADEEYKCFYFEIAGKECEIPVEIRPCSIKDVSFTPVKDYVVIEGLSGGEYDDEGDYYDYYIPSMNIGDKFTVTMEDGSTVEYVHKAISAAYGPAFLNEDGELLGFSMTDNQKENHWVPGGEHNYFTILCGGKEIRVPVTVKEKMDIDRISFTPVKERIYCEKTSEGDYRYWEVQDEKTGEILYKKYFYFYSTTELYEGDKITLHKADGTTVDCVFDAERYAFVTPDGAEIYYYTNHNQYDNPWVVGGKNNYFELYVGEGKDQKICKVYVTVTDCIHEYVNHAGKAANCTEKGWEAYTTCKHCSYTTYKEIPASGHRYTSKVTKNATCTTKGVITYTCSCKASYTSEIPATGKHTVVTDKGTPATYKKAGKTDGSHCSVCNTVIKAQTTIAKLKLGKTTGLKASKMTLAKSSTVTLSWKKVDGAEKYEVYQQSGKKWKKIGTTSKTSLTVKKLTAGKSYKFKVRATLKGETSGAYSSVLTVSLTPAKTTLTLKAGKKQLTASWKAVSGATGYEVQYSTAKNFKKGTKTVTIKKAKTKKTTIKKLTKGKKYYVRIRAYKTVNGKKIYGSWSAVKNVKSK